MFINHKWFLVISPGRKSYFAVFAVTRKYVFYAVSFYLIEGIRIHEAIKVSNG